MDKSQRAKPRDHPFLTALFRQHYLEGLKLRTADEFNSFYQKQDPWNVRGASSTIRDQVFYNFAYKYAANKSVLELGCGEGNHTQHIFSKLCRSVTGVDISEVALNRAASLQLTNAKFQVKDFLNVELSPTYDAIFALECLYYLNPEEQKTFFKRLKVQARDKFFIMSAPIIGKNEFRTYFTEPQLKALFKEFGFDLLESRNLSLYWGNTAFEKILFLPIRILNKIKLINSTTIQLLPSFFIYQKIFVVKVR